MPGVFYDSGTWHKETVLRTLQKGEIGLNFGGFRDYVEGR